MVTQVKQSVIKKQSVFNFEGVKAQDPPSEVRTRPTLAFYWSRVEYIPLALHSIGRVWSIFP
jgi:hypothetical protein